MCLIPELSSAFGLGEKDCWLTNDQEQYGHTVEWAKPFLSSLEK